MRAVLQRVNWARVEVEGETVGSIQGGICALVGVGRADTLEDAKWLAEKVTTARIFEDADGKMNLSLLEQAEPALLAISQFTLYGDLRRGRRPSFSEAMAPEVANELFEAFCQLTAAHGVAVHTGRFRTHMEVSLNNSGPVTLLLDSDKLF
jgi:D-tyrosyl-tRNA(Tyr) deacylase